jgi:hypothetical protein
MGTRLAAFAILRNRGKRPEFASFFGKGTSGEGGGAAAGPFDLVSDGATPHHFRQRAPCAQGLWRL